MKECLALEKGMENNILRTKSIHVSAIDKSLLQFIELMKKTMRAEDGVGLAAPQVGKNIRLIVAEIEQSRVVAMINPEIVFLSDEKNQDDEEGCLSVPGKFGKVWRSNVIIVEYTDEKKQKQKRKFSGFSARIIQHEVDHLDGILFVDRMTKNDISALHVPLPQENPL